MDRIQAQFSVPLITQGKPLLFGLKRLETKVTCLNCFYSLSPFNNFNRNKLDVLKLHLYIITLITHPLSHFSSLSVNCFPLHISLVTQGRPPFILFFEKANT